MAVVLCEVVVPRRLLITQAAPSRHMALSVP